jgi:hypothetical protein
MVPPTINWFQNGLQTEQPEIGLQMGQKYVQTLFCDKNPAF